MTTNQAARILPIMPRLAVTITPAQRLALAAMLGLLLAVIPRLGFNPPDADTRAYAQTALAMKGGTGYYEAIPRSLAAPPTQARSLRLPTTSWVLSLLPQWSWVLLEALAWTLALVLGARLSARPLLFLGLAGLWFAVANRQGVALYPEIYGLPLAMLGFERLRKGHDAEAALCFLGAFCFRELYAVGLIAGLMVRRAWPWLACLGASMLLYLSHVLAAKPHLARIGYEKPFGAEGYNLNMLGEVLSPSADLVGLVFALGCIGIAGWVLTRRRDLFTALYLGAFFVLTLWSLRGYWQTCWVPMLLAVASAVRTAEEMQ